MNRVLLTVSLLSGILLLSCTPRKTSKTKSVQGSSTSKPGDAVVTVTVDANGIVTASPSSVEVGEGQTVRFETVNCVVVIILGQPCLTFEGGVNIAREGAPARAHADNLGESERRECSYAVHVVECPDRDVVETDGAGIVIVKRID